MSGDPTRGDRLGGRALRAAPQGSVVAPATAAGIVVGSRVVVAAAPAPGTLHLHCRPAASCSACGHLHEQTATNAAKACDPFEPCRTGYPHAHRAALEVAHGERACGAVDRPDPAVELGDRGAPDRLALRGRRRQHPPADAAAPIASRVSLRMLDFSALSLFRGSGEGWLDAGRCGQASGKERQRRAGAASRARSNRGAPAATAAARGRASAWEPRLTVGRRDGQDAPAAEVALAPRKG